MDISNIIGQLQQSSADFMENYCVINGNIWRIDQIENMDLKEYASMSVYSLPLKFYKYFSDLSVDGKNYSVIALETNEVYLNSPNSFDDVFDSEINVSFDEFELYRLRKLIQWMKCACATDSSAQELWTVIVQHAYSMMQDFVYGRFWHNVSNNRGRFV